MWCFSVISEYFICTERIEGRRNVDLSISSVNKLLEILIVSSVSGDFMIAWQYGYERERVFFFKRFIISILAYFKIFMLCY